MFRFLRGINKKELSGRAPLTILSWYQSYFDSNLARKKTRTPTYKKPMPNGHIVCVGKNWFRRNEMSPATIVTTTHRVEKLLKVIAHLLKNVIGEFIVKIVENR